MNLVNYKTIKLDTPPPTGKNPPSGAVMTWETLDEDNNLIINYRLSDGTEKTLETGNGNGGGSYIPAMISLTSPDGSVWDITVENDGSTTRTKRTGEGAAAPVSIAIVSGDESIWDLTITNDGEITRTKRSI